MKKYLLVLTLVGVSSLFSGCGKQDDNSAKPEVVKEVEEINPEVKEEVEKINDDNAVEESEKLLKEIEGI